MAKKQIEMNFRLSKDKPTYSVNADGDNETRVVELTRSGTTPRKTKWKLSVSGSLEDVTADINEIGIDLLNRTGTTVAKFKPGTQQMTFQQVAFAEAERKKAEKEQVKRDKIDQKDSSEDTFEEEAEAEEEDEAEEAEEDDYLDYEEESENELESAKHTATPL